MEKTRDVFIKKTDEEILVVSRQELFPSGPLHGLVAVDMKVYEERALKAGSFMWRSLAETNPAFKQIIPYLVFTYNNRFFVMQRKSNASEVRLRNKYSLGIGGHIRKEDIEGKTFVDWARREFEEEVSYSGSFSIEPIGLLNEDETSVGQVHAGFVFLLTGDSGDIAIRSEHKSGELLSLEECEKIYDTFEVWSAWVLDYLKTQRTT